VTKGTAPYFSLTVDPATNRIGGRTYDGNGNLTWVSGWQTDARYDVENRLSYIWPSGASGATNYGYDPENHRVWVRTPDGGEDIHLYGLGGRLMAKLSHYEYVYLGSKLVYKKAPVFNGLGVGEINVLEDRVGSVGSYFPYGVERAASRENDVKFATYHRDSTGLDYANQRYYDSRVGRFLTPDPSSRANRSIREVGTSTRMCSATQSTTSIRTVWKRVPGIRPPTR
jgi:RHS repeat-associated protein